jgi:hypothetical protein
MSRLAPVRNSLREASVLPPSQDIHDFPHSNPLFASCSLYDIATVFVYVHIVYTAVLFQSLVGV